MSLGGCEDSEIIHIKDLGQSNWAQYTTAFINVEINEQVMNGWMERFAVGGFSAQLSCSF